MTIPAVGGVRSPVRCAAAASAAVRRLLDGHPAPGRVLGCSGAAAWIAVADEVVVLGASDAVRLPNGVALGIPSGRAPLGFEASAADCTVGGGGIAFPGLDVRVVRWWDPRPALPPVTATAVLRSVGGLRGRAAGPSDPGLGRALASREPVAAVEAALHLLGRGDGLTPAGDDLVAGALAGYALIGEALGDAEAARVVGAVAGPLDRAARERTTSLSAALLRHACRGEVAEPAAGMLRALAGRGDLEAAWTRLCEVGHSSGPALAAGIVIGAAAAAGREVS